MRYIVFSFRTLPKKIAGKCKGSIKNSPRLRKENPEICREFRRDLWQDRDFVYRIVHNANTRRHEGSLSLSRQIGPQPSHKK